MTNEPFCCSNSDAFTLRHWQIEGELRRSKLLEKSKKRRRTEDDPASEPARLSEASEPATSQSAALQTAQPLGHVNLFEGVVLPEIVGKGKGSGRGGVGSLKAEAEGAAEDVKHRLGYGCVSGVDGVAKPWYLEKPGLAKAAAAEEGIRTHAIGKASRGTCLCVCFSCALSG
jgi:hypothetical protein